MENKLCLCGCGYPTGQRNGVIRGHAVHRVQALADAGQPVVTVDAEIMYLTVPVTIGVNVAAWANDYGDTIEEARREIPAEVRGIITEAITSLAPRRYLLDSVRVKRATVVNPTGDPVGYVPSAAVHTLVNGYIRHDIVYQDHGNIGYGVAVVDLIMAESGMDAEAATEWAGDMIEDAKADRL